MNSGNRNAEVRTQAWNIMRTHKAGLVSRSPINTEIYPSLQAVSGHSNSSLITKYRVASRIQGIDNNYRMGIESNFANVHTQMYAVVFDGTDEIYKFLDSSHRRREEIEDQIRRYDRATKFPGLNGLSTEHVSLGLAGSLTALEMIMLTLIGKGYSGGAIGFGLFLPMLFVYGPETFYRYANSFDYNENSYLRSVKDFLDQSNDLPSGYWQYDARDYRIPLEIYNAIANEGSIGDLYKSQARDEIETRLGRFLRKLKNNAARESLMSIHFDRLLRKNPQNDSPQLIFVMRASLGPTILTPTNR